MAWESGYIISGGELQGSIIGVTNVVSAYPDYDALMRVYETYRNGSASFEFYNTDFNKQIDITSIITSGISPQGGIVIAKINLVNSNKDITGRFCIKLLKSENDRAKLCCYIEDPDGNFITYIDRTVGGQSWNYMYTPERLKKVYLCLCVVEDGNKKLIGWSLNGSEVNNSGAWIGYGSYTFQGAVFNANNLQTIAGISGELPEPKNKSPEFGPASEPGGYGPGSGGSGGSGGPAPTFDDTSDPWTPTPTKPGVLSYGLLNIYKADTGALLNLGRELFPSIPAFPAPVDPGQADLATYLKYAADIAKWLTNSVNALAESIWNKDLINFIVSCHLVPIDVSRGALEDIEVGARTLTGILAGRVTNDVIEFDCGTVHIDEFYTNYVDYMTSCRLYLPYYGMVTIKPEYWQSADISIKYLWNIVDGSFTAQVFSTITRHQSPCTTLIGQYSGNACIHMPLSGTNYATMFATLAGAAGGIAAGVATGNVKVTASSAMALAGGIGSAGDMQMSNAYNATSSFYSHSRPFLIIERPISHFSENYTQEKGIPLYVAKKLSACSGFTVVEDPILDFACSDDEAEAIRHALKTGVIL